MTKYMHEANKANGRRCHTESEDPCGWCLLELIRECGETAAKVDKILAESINKALEPMAAIANALEQHNERIKILEKHQLDIHINKHDWHSHRLSPVIDNCPCCHWMAKECETCRGACSCHWVQP